MTTNKNNNKSMFLYTALIFVVAILLIVLSIFGQTNLQKSQPEVEQTLEPSKQLGNSISEKAAVLSEENMVLLEENKSLKSENEKLKEQSKNVDLLMSANGYMSMNNKEKAAEQLAKVNAELLTEDQKILYNQIKEFVK
ncbi:MAG: hypothetical protein SOS24_00380 [Clostridia bacterium]|nr:hypothetical protein [Clostridia bacterium]